MGERKYERKWVISVFSWEERDGKTFLGLESLLSGPTKIQSFQFGKKIQTKLPGHVLDDITPA